MDLAFAQGTPEAVRQRAQYWLNFTDLDSRVRAAICRLASHPAMTTLWREKIPADPSGMEVSILDRAVVAYSCALTLQPPIPRTRAALTEYLQHHSLVPFGFLEVAAVVRFLIDKLAEVPGGWRSRWSEVSPTSSTFETALTALRDIAAVCDRLDVEARTAEAALDLPKPPRRIGAKNAQRTYFGLIMTDFLARVYHRPCDPVVTILEDVTFDLKGEIEEATARSRRRRSG
jgi:hypothetical protein